MTITPDELEALVAHITDLEARVAGLEAEKVELERHIDYYLRENVFLKEGAKGLERLTPNQTVQKKLPPGYAYGNAGQVIVVNPTLAGITSTGSRHWRPD